MAGYEKIGARWKSVANGVGSSKNPVDLVIITGSKMGDSSFLRHTSYPFLFIDGNA